MSAIFFVPATFCRSCQSFLISPFCTQFHFFALNFTFLHWWNCTVHWFGINWHVLSQSEYRNCCLNVYYYDKNEGVTLINILILVKLLNVWIAGDTETVETCFKRVIFFLFPLGLYFMYLLNAFFFSQDSVRLLSKCYKLKTHKP